MYAVPTFFQVERFFIVLFSFPFQERRKIYYDVSRELAKPHQEFKYLEFLSVKDEFVVNVRWLWVPLVGTSVFLALPGNSTIRGVLGDVVGHFFTAALLAVVPIVGYRFLYNQIGEKEVTYIFAASWAYLVISQFLGF